MEMYLIPEPAALFWAMLLLLASGMVGFLCARRLRWGVALGLAIVALACAHLLPPLIPPARLPAADRDPYWRDVRPVVATAVVAALLPLVGIWWRLRRSAG